MALYTVRQPVEVIVHNGLTHYVNAGRCLQCGEREVYLTENGGSLLATIRPAEGQVAYVDVETH